MIEDVSHLLNQIKHREIVLPEFQREFTWDKKQSKVLIDSLLEGYPTGSLLVWSTSDPPALKNSPDINESRVDVLLDGQQRLTVLYSLVLGEIPPYYSELDNDPRNLQYHLGTGELKYYKKNEMSEDPEWVSVTECFTGAVKIEDIAEKLSNEIEERYDRLVVYKENYDNLRSITEQKFPIMNVDDNSSLAEALTVFDRVNSQGTPLSDADIALAHMVSSWPDTRREFKSKLNDLEESSFEFDLTFLVRAMNAVINQSSEFEHLHDLDEAELLEGWNNLSRMLDYLVNVLTHHAYIYSTNDLNTPYVLIPMLAYLSVEDGEFSSARQRDLMLYWMYAALIRRRHTRSLDAALRQDMNMLESEDPLVGLITTLKEEEGDPHVTPEKLDMRGIRHPLYNMTNIVIRANGGVDWRNGIDLSEPIGKDYEIESHHIFPRAQLRRAGYDTNRNHYDKKRVNEIANRVPLTRRGNRGIFDSKPSDYLRRVDKKYPDALETSLIPDDPDLWKMEKYEEFLQIRRRLIADEINQYMSGFLTDDLINNGIESSA